MDEIRHRNGPSVAVCLLVPLLLLVCVEIRGEEDFWPPRPLPNYQAKLVAAPSSVEREFAQTAALIKAQAWEEAVDNLLRLADESPHVLVLVADDHYLPLATACQWQIARWPAEALAVYRQRVDTAASNLFANAQAAETNDKRALQLRRIAESYFASSVGDEALWMLGDIALEQGDYSLARECWLKLAPQLWSSGGVPWGIALQGVDQADDALRQSFAGAVAQQFDDPTQDGFALAYPDTNVPLPEILARLAMVSIREGSFPRAQAEAFVLRELYPAAEGRLAGREVVLSSAVDEALAAASHWPKPIAGEAWETQGGNAARGLVASPRRTTDRVRWRVALDRQPTQAAESEELWLSRGGLRRFSAGPPAPTFVQPLSEGNAIVYFDSNKWKAIDVDSGRPLFGKSGMLYEEASLWAGSNRQQLGQEPQRALLGGGVRFRVGAGGPLLMQGRPAVANGSSRGLGTGTAEGAQLGTVSQGTLFCVLGPRTGSQPLQPNAPPPRLLGLDLSAEGKLQLEISPAAGMRFSGPPVVRGDTLYAPLRETEVSGRLQIAAYHRHSGRQLWITPVCSFSGNPPTPHADLLTLGENKLYINTSAGVVAAVGIRQGQLAWARTYHRQRSELPSDLSDVPLRLATPCLLARGVLVCTATDSAGLFALDAATGQALWHNAQAYDAYQLLGEIDGTLVASGTRIWFIDLLTGTSKFAWPESTNAGIVGRGRGCLAGDEVFWPTKHTLYTLNIHTGQHSRLPMPLAHLKREGEISNGANLSPAAGGLLVATQQTLTLLAPPLRDENGLPHTNPPAANDSNSGQPRAEPQAPIFY